MVSITPDLFFFFYFLFLTNCEIVNRIFHSLLFSEVLKTMMYHSRQNVSSGRVAGSWENRLSKSRDRQASIFVTCSDL